MSCANKDPFNDESDVFMKISVDGLVYIDEHHWKDNQAPKNVKKNVFCSWSPLFESKVGGKR